MSALPQCSQCLEVSVKVAVTWFLAAGVGFLLDAPRKQVAPMASVETMLPTLTAIKTDAMMEVTPQHVLRKASMALVGLPLHQTSIQGQALGSELGMFWLLMGAVEVKAAATQR